MTEKKEVKEQKETLADQLSMKEMTPDFSNIYGSELDVSPQIQEAFKASGYAIGWGARAVAGQPNNEGLRLYRKKAWVAVTADELKEITESIGCGFQPNEIGDLFLMKRRLEWHKQEAGIYDKNTNDNTRLVQDMGIGSGTGLQYFGNQNVTDSNRMF
jgi:hypothetical protein